MPSEIKLPTEIPLDDPGIGSGNVAPDTVREAPPVQPQPVDIAPPPPEAVELPPPPPAEPVVIPIEAPPPPPAEVPDGESVE